MSSWVWCISILDDDKFGVCTDDGEVAVFRINYLPIFGFHKEVYVNRENLTDLSV